MITSARRRGSGDRRRGAGCTFRARGAWARSGSGDRDRSATGTFLRPFDVAAVDRVDDQLFPLGDEGRDLHDHAVLEGRRLVRSRCGGSLDERLGLDDFRAEGLRELDADRLRLVELCLELEPGCEPLRRVAEIFVAHLDLLVVLDVHEVVSAAVGVHVLHLVRLDERLLDCVAGAEAVLELVPRPEIAELRLHHGAEIPRGVVAELHHLAKVVVEEDDHPVSKVVCLHGLLIPFAKTISRGCGSWLQRDRAGCSSRRRDVRVPVASLPESGGLRAKTPLQPSGEFAIFRRALRERAGRDRGGTRMR
jgi:hypothetical protein